MLTADLVRARVQKGALVLSALNGKTRARALEVAEAYLLAADQPGASRRELEEAFGGVAISARERKLADGLKKLVLDRCEIEVHAEIDPIELRRDLFLRAAAARQELEVGELFDRDRLLADFAAERELSEEDLERLLFADLRQEQRLVRFERTSAERLVELYELAQEQAVLLRAESVEVDLWAQPAVYRFLFRKMKFLRLLHTIERQGDGYRVTIDGPYSLFSSVTKYGLQLALLLPALRSCDRYRLRAQLRWGREKRRVELQLEGGSGSSEQAEAPALPEEVATLLERMKARDSSWEPTVSTEVLSVPGLGEIVPDLVFVDRLRGVRIYLEVLGYWSREAVFRRLELVEEGLREPLLFALPKRLRVREDLPDDDLPIALYVYKGSISPKAIEQRLDAIAAKLLPNDP